MPRLSRPASGAPRPAFRSGAILLSLASVALSLVIAEVGLRLFSPVSFREPPRREPGDVWRELLHRRSSFPGLSYELAPNMEKWFPGTVIRTNSHGMREREIPIEKPGSVVRIAALGDSFTFGFGVADRQTYPRVLEALLNRSATSGRRFEVLNFGVGGYSTRDEAILLQHKALEWRPDLVILGYVLNDPEDEPFQPLHSYYQDPAWWQRFAILRLGAKAAWQWRVKRFGDGDYIRSLYGDPRKWNGNMDAFRSIQEIAREHALRVVVAIFPYSTVDDWATYPYADIHERVARAASTHEFDAIDLLPVFASHLPRDLRLAAANAHPSVEGHSLAGQAIAERLRADEPRYFGSSPP